MKEIDNPAFREALEQLRENLQEMSPEQMRQPLEDVEFNEERYKERLERSIEPLSSSSSHPIWRSWLVLMRRWPRKKRSGTERVKTANRRGSEQASDQKSDESENSDQIPTKRWTKR